MPSLLRAVLSLQHERRCVGLALAVSSAALVTACSTPGASPLAPSSPAALTPEELALDCKTITGRMQVRILQIRDYAPDQQGTIVARSMQQATTTLVGGTNEGADPQSRLTQDKAKLTALNARLAEKGCPTFDLASELTPKPASVTPMPVRR